MNRCKLLTMVTLAAFFAVGTQGSRSGVSVTITAPTSPVTLGHAIPIKVELTDTSGHEISVSRGIGHAEAEVTYEVTMYDSTGHPVQRTNHGDAAAKKQLISSVRVVSLQPGEKLTQTMELTKVFRITQPGTYTIRVGRRWPEETGETQWSNSLSLSIEK